MAIRYSVEIRETLSRIIEVEAITADDAIQIAKEKYNKEEVVLDYEDFCCCEIELQSNHSSR